jgi:D-alanine-D-alanine ligase
MKKKVYIIQNIDGPESEFSALSVSNVLSVLNGEVVPVSRCTYLRTIQKLVDGVCFLCTHGGYGENGMLQNAMKEIGVMHTHSNPRAAFVMSSKHLTKKHYLRLGIPTPDWIYRGHLYGDSTQKISCFVHKPDDGGSKNGIFVSVNGNLRNNEIGERLIQGDIEVSIVVYGSNNPICFPPLLRERNINNIGVLRETTAKLDNDLLKKCSYYAKIFHISLGARGLSKTDFVISPEGFIYALETDSQPGLALNQASARQANAYGLSYDKFIEGILNDREK